MPLYEFQCRSCEKVFAVYCHRPHTEMENRCTYCEGTGDRIYSVCNMKIWEPFTTKNILPDGEPVTVRGPGQLRQLEAEHGVKQVDGPPPKTIPPQPS